MINLTRLYREAEKNPGVDPVEVVAKALKKSNKQVLEELPWEEYIDYLVREKIIPDISSSTFLDRVFRGDWLNSMGALEE